MLSNILGRKPNSLVFQFLACLAITALVIGLGVGLADPAQAGTRYTPVQLEISVRQRVLWTQQTVEYRVTVDQPDEIGIREVTVQYKVIDQKTPCNAAASWSTNLHRHYRHVWLNKWKTKPNYLFLNRDTALKYLGKKFCFRVSKAASGGQFYRHGYAEIEVKKWWTGVDRGGVCARVYTWIEDASIARGGQTTIHWKIVNVRSSASSVRVTAHNHNYWFYDTAQAEPNIKKPFGNPHEVTSSYDAATDTITASRTVVGHLAPKEENLYMIAVSQLNSSCPTARDAVFMRVIDY